MMDYIQKRNEVLAISESDYHFTKQLVASVREITQDELAVDDWTQLISQSIGQDQAFIEETHFVTVALAKLSIDLMARMQQFLVNALNATESPIEKYMLVGLVIAGHETTDSVILAPYGNPQGMIGHPIQNEVWIQPQAQIGEYRVDFLVTWRKLDYDVGENGRVTPQATLTWSVVVECDGHDFHEKTKGQAQRDKERDRELQRVGYNVFRFTGSEIWKDALHCAREVMEFLEAKALSKPAA
jgi:very-short-patch-repair endonuclease